MVLTVPTGVTFSPLGFYVIFFSFVWVMFLYLDSKYFLNSMNFLISFFVRFSVIIFTFQMFSITLSLFSVIFCFCTLNCIYINVLMRFCGKFLINYIHMYSVPYINISFFYRVVGENDGMVLGRRYFQCPLYHGVFVRANNVRFIPLIRW